GARHLRGGGGQALPPGPGPPQGPAQPTARGARGIPAMNAQPTSETDPLDPVAEEFLGRLRKGERPPLSEYVARSPDLAGRIREVFPALALLEQGAPSAATGATGPFTAAAAAAAGTPRALGEFRIVREIGHGGMGVVYEAV